MEGCRRINVLIGPPNVGKSNILEAMSLYHFADNNINCGLRDLVRIKDNRDLFNNWNVGNEILVNIDDSHVLNANYGQKGQVEMRFQENSDYLTNGDNKSHLDLYKSLSANLDGAIYVTGDSGYEIIDFPSIKFYKYQEQPQVLKKGLPLKAPFGENLLDTLVLHPTLRKSIVQLIKLYNLKLVIELETHEVKFTRFFGDDTFINVPYYLFADTLKRLIFFQAAIQTNSQSIILFEEPEAHCFEPYILETTNAIKNDTNGNQFFLVTHSSFVVQELLRDQDIRKEVSVFLVDNNEQMETAVKRLEDEHLYDIHTSGIDLFFNFKSLWKETEYV